MIVTEPYEGSTELVITYSDAGFLIRQDGTGVLYESAVDGVIYHRTYTETDIPIEHEE